MSLLSLFDAHVSRRFEYKKDAKMTLQSLTDHGSSSSRPAVIELAPNDLEGSII